MYPPSRTRGTRRSIVPTRVSHRRSRYPLRCPVRSSVRSWRPAPSCCVTSTSISAWASTRTPSRKKSLFIVILPNSSASAILISSAIVVLLLAYFQPLHENHTVAVSVHLLSTFTHYTGRDRCDALS